jgi:hypothetical protein
MMDPSSQSQLVKSKRGRPRKSGDDASPPLVEEIYPDEIVLAKKRGRKKKSEQITVVSLGGNRLDALCSIIQPPKTYIVQLKVRTSDLEKIQNKFINQNKTTQYQSPTSTDDTCATYHDIVNKLQLQMPEADSQLGTANASSSSSFPRVPYLYQDIVIPVTPANVPIKLFDEEPGNNQDDQLENPISTRETSAIMMPIITTASQTQWPERSPYACWNCDTYFTGTPIGLPEKEVDGRFYCSGNFCSFECAARYLSDRERTCDFWSKYSTLCVIYQMAYELPPEARVSIAPPRESLTKYGGTLSYEEYHLLTTRGKTTEIYKLPIIPVMLHIGEVSRSMNLTNLMTQTQTQDKTPSQSQVALHAPVTKTRQSILLDAKRIVRAEENFRQKTMEILQSSQTLEKCLKRVTTKGI